MRPNERVDKKTPMAPRAMSLVLTVGLVAAGAITLAGCTEDSRVGAIDQAVQAAMTSAAPDVIGVRTGDVAAALKNAGNASQVMVPVMVADLSTAAAPGPPLAQPATPSPSASLDDTAQSLADAAVTAWQGWLAANPDGVEYIQTTIPATVGTGSDKQVSVTLDRDALTTFAQPFAAADAQVFMRTAESSPQWLEQMVYTHAADFVRDISGLPSICAGQATPTSCQELTTLTSVDPAGDGTFAVTVTYPDPKSVVDYQVAQALKSYGTGKIWGGVSTRDFTSKVNGVTDIPSSVGPPVTTKATVTVQASGGDASYDPGESLAANLASQATRYKVAVQPGSYQAPTGVADTRTKAVNDAMKTLDKQVIKSQPLPSSTRLAGGGSGHPFTVKSVNFADVHITFFAWGTTKQVVSVFVRSGKTLSFRVPTGSYRIVLATGSTWYGPKYSFGPDGNYQEFKNSPGATSAYKYTAKANQTSTLTLGSTGGGTSVPSGPIDNPFAS